ACPGNTGRSPSRSPRPPYSSPSTLRESPPQPRGSRPAGRQDAPRPKYSPAVIRPGHSFLVHPSCRHRGRLAEGSPRHLHMFSIASLYVPAGLRVARAAEAAERGWASRGRPASLPGMSGGAVTASRPLPGDRGPEGKSMGEIAGAHAVPAQSHHAAEAEAVFVISAGAERAQHEDEKITACGPGNIKVLWLTPAEAHSLSSDLSNAA